MSKIIFIGEYLFPSDYASCNRVLYEAMCAKEAGYEPFVIGEGSLPEGETVGSFKGISYTTVKNNGPKWKKVITAPYDHYKYARILKKYIDEGDVKAVIIYASASYKFVPQVVKLCKKRGIKCVCDVSEWYKERQDSNGLRGWNYRRFTYIFENRFADAQNIICCSELVKNYFEQKNCSCFKINGIIDINEFEPSFTAHDRITLIYAGVAGRKDRLLEFFQGLDELYAEGEKNISLKVVGMSRDYLNNLLEEQGYKLEDKPYFEILNRMPKKTLTEHIKTASYSVLLRPNERYANAGFPSKVSESMALGTPMLCNLTSDLQDYVTNDNGVVIDGCSKESVVKALRERVLKTDGDDGVLKRKRAYETAKAFDYREFVQGFKEFIEK